jgi:uncharacterized membrane protein (DUF2068 family)
MSEGSRGVRLIAAFEAAKGLLVLLLGLGLLDLLHKDIEAAAENLLFRLHLDGNLRLTHAFLQAVAKLNDARLWALAAAAAAYATVRFVEAWGLWRRRAWAEWFALASGALYLPWELLQLARKVNWPHVALVAGNIVILLYLARLRLSARRHGA